MLWLLHFILHWVDRKLAWALWSFCYGILIVIPWVDLHTLGWCLFSFSIVLTVYAESDAKYIYPHLQYLSSHEIMSGPTRLVTMSLFMRKPIQHSFWRWLLKTRLIALLLKYMKGDKRKLLDEQSRMQPGLELLQPRQWTVALRRYPEV